ncbi:hypothetical protein Ddc_06891 [Ditylenchus destructor]|nr:hypothetical protein Ddc_06891 [Ditylenchus destructor]
MAQASEEPAHSPPPDPTPTPDPEMAEKLKDEMEKFKVYLNSTLTANSSVGCSLTDFCQYFEKDWGKSLNFYARKFGYKKVVDFLKALPEDIRINSDLHVTVVPNDDTKHVLSMVDRTYVDGKTIAKPSRCGPPPKPCVPRPRVITVPRMRSNMSQNFRVPPRNRPAVAGLFAKTKQNKWEPPFGYPQNPNLIPIEIRNQFGQNRIAKSAPRAQNTSPYNQLDPKAQIRIPSRTTFDDDYFGDDDWYYDEPGTSRSIASKYETTGSLNRNDYAPPGEVEYRRDQYWQRDDRSGVYDEAQWQEQEEFCEEYGAIGEVDDNYSDISDDEFFSAEEFDDDDLLDYDDSGAAEQCEEFLEEMQKLKPIPPNLYRMVHLLREAASDQTMEQLKKAYEKRYITKLDIAELRRVLGAKVSDGAKTSEAAFKLCALRSVFKSAVQPGGTTKVRLILDEDLDDGTNSIAASSRVNLDQSFGSNSAANKLSRGISMMSLASTQSSKFSGQQNTSHFATSKPSVQKSESSSYIPPPGFGNRPTMQPVPFNKSPAKDPPPPGFGSQQTKGNTTFGNNQAPVSRFGTQASTGFGHAKQNCPEPSSRKSPAFGSRPGSRQETPEGETDRRANWDTDNSAYEPLRPPSRSNRSPSSNREYTATTRSCNTSSANPLKTLNQVTGAATKVNDNSSITEAKIIMMACCVHDLAAKEAKTLSYLYDDIKKQEKLAYLAQSKTQFLGTLRMFFADSFEFVQGNSENGPDVLIKSTKTKPSSKITKLNVQCKPRCNTFRADSDVHVGDVLMAKIVRFDGSTPERPRMTCNLKDARVDELAGLLREYDSVLQELEELPITPSLNQLCLYRKAGRLARGRLVDVNENQAFILEDVDNGEVVIASSDQIFEFPAEFPLEDYPLMAVHVNFGMVEQLRDTACFQQTKQLIDSLINNDEIVELFIGRKSRDEHDFQIRMLYFDQELKERRYLFDSPSKKNAY